MESASSTGMLCYTLANGSVNMGYAMNAGMKVELGMGIGARYSIALLVFFPSYLIFELPSNWCLVRFGVWKTLTFLITAWGLIVMGMGFVNSWVCLFWLGLISERPRCPQILPRLFRSWNHSRNSVSHQLLVPSIRGP
jgi:hypothetical protein